jgi:subtilisin family serine protease/subtilisin-like proprotein convertase family protein
MGFLRSSRSRWRLGLATAAAIAAVFSGTPALAAPAEGQVLHAGGATAVADSYIVVLKDRAVTPADVASKTRDLASRYGGSVTRTYQHALRGFEARLSATAAKRLAADPSVRYVEQNHTVRVASTQNLPPSWGLDRIDQRSLPLNHGYTYYRTSGVRAYVLDTGIRFSHVDFGGRAISGFDAIDGGTADDCDGHGTHVAGTIGGATYGVAKGVTLVAVRVLDCAGNGTWAQIIAGVDWVTGDHQPGEPAVANMSLAGDLDQAVNDAVSASIADGITYGVAAANFSDDACRYSPGSTPDAITVGATTSTDEMADYSSYGTCVDIFAPGTSITSAYDTGDTASYTASGTSMATPHVVGAAALVLAAHPTYTPQQVRDTLVNDATTGVLTGLGAGSPDKLLYVGGIPSPTQDFSVALSPTNRAVDVGGSLTATVRTTTTVGDPQQVSLTASGLPTGATASFSPSSLRSGDSSTLTIGTTDATVPGVYHLTITGTGSVTTQIASYTLTILGPPGCRQGNGTAVAIPDDGTAVGSSATISGCPGNASSGSTVEVHLKHDFIGDLIVSLVAPDGTAYPLQNQTGGGNTHLDETFIVNLSSEVADGTWTLRTQDVSPGAVGSIDSWALNLAGTVSDCASTSGTDVAIPDPGTVESSITIAGCSGNASAASAVEVHVVHPYIKELIVTLVAPDGSTHTLHNLAARGGGNVWQNLDTAYTVDLSGEVRNGTWKLRVQDTDAGSSGYLTSWTLSLGDPPVPWWTVVDDSSPGFQASANWSTSSALSQPYGSGYRLAAPQAISDPAWYSADLPGTGTYQVEVWYPALGAYSVNAATPYLIVTPSGYQTVKVDQRSDGGQWVNLGTFSMTGGTHNVVGVSRWASGTSSVIADAVRVTRIS